MSKAPPALSEEQWLTILAATAPLQPDSRARQELDECLNHFDGLRRPGADPVAERDAWRRIDKLAGDLARALYRVKRRTPREIHDPDWPQRNILALKPIRQQSRVRVEGYSILARAAQGRRDPPREWLFWRLLTIWTDGFGGKLAVTTPPKGGPPVGPLVRFIQAAAAPVLDEVPTADAIRTIVREHRRRMIGKR